MGSPDQGGADPEGLSRHRLELRLVQRIAVLPWRISAAVLPRGERPGVGGCGSHGRDERAHRSQLRRYDLEPICAGAHRHGFANRRFGCRRRSARDARGLDAVRAGRTLHARFWHGLRVDRVRSDGPVPPPAIDCSLPLVPARGVGRIEQSRGAGRAGRLRAGTGLGSQSGRRRPHADLATRSSRASGPAERLLLPAAGSLLRGRRCLGIVSAARAGKPGHDFPGVHRRGVCGRVAPISFRRSHRRTEVDVGMRHRLRGVPGLCTCPCTACRRASTAEHAFLPFLVSGGDSGACIGLGQSPHHRMAARLCRHGDPRGDAHLHPGRDPFDHSDDGPRPDPSRDGAIRLAATGPDRQQLPRRQPV